MGGSENNETDPRERQEMALARLEENLCVLQAQAGQVDAFTRLVQRYEAPLLYYLRRFIKDPGLALDAHQEVWLEAWRGLPHLLAPEAFRVWIYRIAHARAARFVRRQVSECEKMNRFTQADPLLHQQSETSFAAETVHLHLEQLPSDQREILTLFYLNDLTLEEIARVLDRPVGTVKSRLHYARINLRHLIEKERI